MVTIQWNIIWQLNKTGSVDIYYIMHGASLVAQLVKNPSAMWETWVISLGWEDLLEKGKATYIQCHA